MRKILNETLDLIRDLLAEGRGLPVGTIRRWGDHEYKKVARNNWVLVKKHYADMHMQAPRKADSASDIHPQEHDTWENPSSWKETDGDPSDDEPITPTPLRLPRGDDGQIDRYFGAQGSDSRTVAELLNTNGSASLSRLARTLKPQGWDILRFRKAVDRLGSQVKSYRSYGGEIHYGLSAGKHYR